MGTLLLEVKAGKPRGDEVIQAMLLAGELRRKAIRGEVPLRQVESQFSRELPLARTLANPQYTIEIFRDPTDDVVIGKIDANSYTRALQTDQAI